MELIRILISPKPHAGNCAVQSWADNRDIVYWFIQDIYRFSFCDILFDDCFLFVIYIFKALMAVQRMRCL